MTLDGAMTGAAFLAYTRHLNRVRAEKNASLASAHSELGRLGKARDRLITAIKDGIPASEVRDELAVIAKRRSELEALLDGQQEEAVLLHPNMANVYREQVAKLADALNAEEYRAQAADIIRSLVDDIVLTPNTDNQLEIDLHGDLAGILTVAMERERRLDDGDLTVRQVKMVAGAGFEPATFRL